MTVVKILPVADLHATPRGHIEHAKLGYAVHVPKRKRQAFFPVSEFTAVEESRLRKRDMDRLDTDFFVEVVLGMPLGCGLGCSMSDNLRCLLLCLLDTSLQLDSLAVSEE